MLLALITNGVFQLPVCIPGTQNKTIIHFLIPKIAILTFIIAIYLTENHKKEDLIDRFSLNSTSNTNHFQYRDQTLEEIISNQQICNSHYT